MPQAIPAAIGLGGSVIGGIQGKGAAKRQERLAREQLELIKPLLQNQVESGRFALDESRPAIRGARKGIEDLRDKFYKPLAFGDRSAINAFLSPERRAINQGYRSSLDTVARFAPRGGGRVSSMIRADQDRQGRLSDLVFNARRAGAEGFGAQNAQLGSLGTTTLGAGLSSGSTLNSLLQNQQGLAQRASENSGEQLAGIGNALGGFLGQIFKPSSGMKSGGNPTTGQKSALSGGLSGLFGFGPGL